MALFDYKKEELLGTVESVDTSSVVIRVELDENLHGLQVNHLVAIQSPNVNHKLIGLVTKIIRKSASIDDILKYENNDNLTFNIIKAILIGTHLNKEGLRDNVFKRTLNTLPAINAECHIINGEKLKKFMQGISSITEDETTNSLEIGNYSIDDAAVAYLNGNKLFQRHSVIVGNTGSGKSWCVASILDKVASLKSADAILFDIHGEYSPLIGDNFVHYKIAGPMDTYGNNILFLPFWLLTYEEMLSLMLDRTDNNAPNQAMIFSNEVIEGKQSFLENNENNEINLDITLDSPIPYNLKNLISNLETLDKQMVQGSTKEKQGTYFGKLTRFCQRLQSKQNDKRLNFMFSEDNHLYTFTYMAELCKSLMQPADNGTNGVKIIDFSEVPSDILPLIVSLIARIIFSVQQWSPVENRHPIAIFCDEAHLYIPSDITKSIDKSSVENFERISKEGRKYGIGLVVISQRPSEVNRTVLSQSNNFIAMRLTNADDQSVIKRLLPDSLGDYAEILPILDIGEAIIVGDASLLPSRIKVKQPQHKPKSATVNFWDEWSKDVTDVNIESAIYSLRRQTK
jgi:hypothetical protein